MEIKRFKKVLQRYIRGKVNEAEHYLVDAWYASFGESNAHVPGLENEQAERLTMNRMHEAIRKRIRPVAFHNQVWFRAAAVVVMMAGVTWFSIWYSREQQPEALVFQTLPGEKRLVTLPDSSKVWLNAGSTLELPDGFSGTSRITALTGEAFFEVSRNPERPFFIITGDLTTKVVGTSFNIRSYAGMNEVLISVKNGIVAVSRADHTADTLRKDQHLHYSKNHDGIMIDSKAFAQNTWVDGWLIMESMKLGDIAIQLEQQFAVKIEFTDDTLRNITLTLRQHNESITNILEVLALTGNFRYKFSNKRIVISK